jgi:ferrochelatase
MDGRVIDIAYPQRFALVNGIIAPFRAPKSAAEYRKLWVEGKGSPLKFYGIDVARQLQDQLGQGYDVKLAMRYQNPSVASVLQEFSSCQLQELIVLPLFPQYASATTGSVVQRVMEEVKDWQVIPSIRFINKFVDNEQYIKLLADVARPYLTKENWDHFLFSYHGVPERQIYKASCNNYCQINDKCCSVAVANNTYCYRAQCFHNSRLLAEALNIPADKYTTCFQSRLGKDPWIQPYADELLKKLPEEGKKKVLAFSPAFVADCLETTVEVGEAFKEEFLEHGGETWELVPSLNNRPEWVSFLADLIKK